jgi:hypothetical protein
MNNPQYQLFFIKNLSNFPDGTLFELEYQLISYGELIGAVNEKRQESADWE